MATGDAAAAAGMPLVPGSLPADQIDTAINETRDLIAQFAGGVRSVAAGGTGASTPSGARANLGLTTAGAPTAGTIPIRDGSGQFGVGAPVNPDHPVRKADLDATTSETARAHTRLDSDNTRLLAVEDARFTTAGYNRNITWSRRAAWWGDDGQLGFASSSERYKKAILPHDVTDEQIAALVLVSFEWRAAVARDDRREVGLIAERVAEAGLEWAVFTDDQGRPEGIAYDRVGIALLPAVQRLIRDRDSILDRIQKLEARDANS